VQRRLLEHADAVIVPSRFARERLRDLGAPLPWDRVHILAPPVPIGDAPAQRRPAGGYALLVSRLAPEKGVDVAIEACRLAGIPLVIAGDGPERAALEARSAGLDVRFEGSLAEPELARLRAGAAVALAPSRSAETFGMAAAEAMAAGLPVAGSRIGALTELLEPSALADPGDAQDLARVIGFLAGDREAGERVRSRVSELCSPVLLASRLSAIYDGRDPA
jgi:glycosyltransferase involved in cell wall biosynthesis